jgi:hypothetical protein
MCAWFSAFYENALVRRVIRRLPIRIERFCRSANDVRNSKLYHYLYGFGVTRGAALALPILTMLSGSRSGGVTTAKFPGHAVTLRRSPTVFADTPISGSTSTRILSGRLPRARLVGARQRFWPCIA